MATEATLDGSPQGATRTLTTYQVNFSGRSANLKARYMGFLKHLLFWPVTGPMYLAEFSLEKVQGVVKEQLTDDSFVKEELLDLQLRLEMGDIDDAEYETEEAQLMSKLREVRRWREEFGMATRGGLVKVAEDDEKIEGGDEIPEEDKRQQPQALTGKAELEITLDFGDEEK